MEGYMREIEFADFDNFKSFKGQFRANDAYKGIEVTMTTKQSKIKNVKTREDINGLIKYRAAVSVNGKTETSSWTYSLTEALEARSKLENLRIKQVYNNQHSENTNLKKIRLGGLIVDFLNDFQKGSGSFSNSRKFLYGKYMKPLFDKYLHELNNEDFSFLWLQISRRDTANTYISFLRALLKYGETKEYSHSIDLKSYVLNGYILCKISHLPVPADTEIVEKTLWLTSKGIDDLLITFKELIDNAYNESFKIVREIKSDILELQLNLSTRPSETPAIDWNKSIKFENGRPSSVHIYKQVIGKPEESEFLQGKQLKPPKYNKERTIKLNKRAIEIIEKYLPYKDSIHPFIDADGSIYNFVFPYFLKGEYVKKPYQVQTLYDIWDVARNHERMKPYNLLNKGGGLYVLRHTGVTHHVYLARKDQYEYKRISKRMGHASYGQLETYIHLIDEIDPLELDRTFSYFKSEHSHVFDFKKESIIASISSKYEGSIVTEIIKILRRDKAKLEPFDELSQLAMLEMSPEDIGFMVDEFRLHERSVG